MTHRPVVGRPPVDVVAMRHKTTPAAWRDPISAWALSMAAAGRSPRTIETRTDHMRRIARALGGSPWTVTDVELIGWAGGQSWRRETRRSVYASARSFWAWAVKTGRATSSPADGLPVVAPEPPMPRPAPESAYRAALASARPREQLILRLAGETGLRRAEVAQVHAQDLREDLAGWSLVVHGKGGRDRLVPLPRPLASAVRVQCAGGWAFPGDDNGHLSPRHVGILASRLLPDGWTLHTLRHRFATTAYSAERDLISVQALLGHASVATTQRYVAAPDGALRRAVDHAARFPSDRAGALGIA